MPWHQRRPSNQRARDDWREENARAAERLAALKPSAWTAAPAGRILAAFGEACGYPVCVREVASLDPLAALARRIVAD